MAEADNDNPDCLAKLGMPHDKRPSMKELTRFLTRFGGHWREIGLRLGLKGTLLDIIGFDNPQKARDCFRVTLQRWLEQNTRADWQTLELAITNVLRQLSDLDPLTMGEMKQKLLALELMNVDELIMPIQELKISAPGYIQRNDNQGQRYAADVMGQRCNSFEQSCDGIQEQKNGGAQEQGSDGCGGYGNRRAVINPETAPTVDCGKGMIKNTVLAEAKKAVCCIKSPIMTGTGFLGYAKCGEKYCTVLVTNNHVIENFGDAMGSRFIFENVLPDRHVILKGADIFVKNSFWCSPLKELDYTLIEIDENELVDKKTNKSLNIEPMQLMRPPNIKRGDHIYVLQHPRGDEFSFSSSESIVLDPLLLYQCTTDRGSSGSPVVKEVDGELKVVALHRGGQETNDKWYGYNCGTLIREILNHLNGNPAPLLPTNKTVQEALKKH